MKLDFDTLVELYNCLEALGYDPAKINPLLAEYNHPPNPNQQLHLLDEWPEEQVKEVEKFYLQVARSLTTETLRTDLNNEV